MTPTPVQTVRSFHEAMQARDWDRAASFLAEDLAAWYPVTDERFRGPQFLAMQRAYPEGWQIDVVELIADGDRAAGRIAVDQDGQRFWCHGCWTVHDGRITEAIELWGTQGSETPPPWRSAFTEG